MLGTSIILNKKAPAPPVKLSLVALMDIFTILVFFLLLNSGDSQTLEDAKFVKLPNSSSQTAPHSELVIHVGTDEVWMDSELVLSLAATPIVDGEPLLALAAALEGFVKKHGELNAHEQENGLSLTIMADKAVPYTVLKSVMATCSEQNFRDVSLAVNHVVGSAISKPATQQANPQAEVIGASEPAPTQANVSGGLE